MSEFTNPAGRGFFAGKMFRVLLVLLVLLLVGLGAFKWIKDNTTLTFGFMLDGRPLPIGVKPTVLVDGQPFASGCSILPGTHTLTAESRIADPISQKVLIICGNKNLGLLPLVSSRGSMLVTANPSPASIAVRRGTEMVATGDSPLTVEKLPFGNYEVEIKRGDYTESHVVKIEGRVPTEAKIDLNLGGARLSSDPSDADFQLVGNGRQWEGKLPNSISDVPAGSYLFTASRGGWDVTTSFSVTAGKILANQLVFPYGVVEVNSDPAGMRISTNGVAVGKTPVVLNEVRPGDYTLVASDGFNDLAADIHVGESKTVGHNFVFRYGKVEINSNPTGATVIKNNKEIGKTPLVIDKLATGKTRLGLQLAGYVTTNYVIAAKEGTPSTFALKLTSEEFLEAMQLAQTTLDARKLVDSRKHITRALGIDPTDAAALQLRDDLTLAEQKAEADRKEVERKAEAERKKAERREITEIIESSITTRGGREAMTRYNAFKCQGTTVGVDSGGNTYSGTFSDYSQGFDQYRIDLRLDVQAKPTAGNFLGGVLLGVLGVNMHDLQQTFCINNGAVWATIRVGNTLAKQTVSPETGQSLLVGMHINRVSSLLPLLTDEYQLEKVTANAPNNTVGIKVTKPGQPVTTLFFDKTSHDLVCMDYPGIDPKGVPVQKRTRHGNFRTISSGVRVPAQIEFYTDGDLSETRQITSQEPVARFQDGVFQQLVSN